MLESVPEILLFGRRVSAEGVPLPVGHREQHPPRRAYVKFPAPLGFHAGPHGANGIFLK